MAGRNPFASVSDPSRPRRSVFDLSYDVKLTADFSNLYPVMCDEVLPGDVFKIGCSQVVRFNPLITPVMHEVNVYVHYFFVPYRLLDDNWETFITGGRTGMDNSTLPRWPYQAYIGFVPDPVTRAEGSAALADYIGLPFDSELRSVTEEQYNALEVYPIDYPRRAYYFIYSQFYWDQNVDWDFTSHEIYPWIRDDLTFDVNSLESNRGEIMRRAWPKDYLTSALPFQQRGVSQGLGVEGSASFPFVVNLDGIPVNVMAQNPVGSRYDNPGDLPIRLRMPTLVAPSGQPPLDNPAGFFYPTFHYPMGPLSPNFPSDAATYNISTSPQDNSNSPESPPGISLYGSTYSFAGSDPRPYSLNWGSSYSNFRGLPPAVSDYYLDGYYYLPKGTRLGTASGSSSGNVDVDFSQTVGFNVSDLRSIFQIQKWLERNARAGVRYVEFLRAHFAAFPRDERLQRPEYIGGTKHQVVISEVLQTGYGSENTPPQGNMTGHGLSVTGNFCGSYRVHEFGLIMGILSILPVPAYEDRLDRQWIKKSRYDFYFPEFAHLSEQEVYNAEVRYNAQESDADGFGFQGRYDELRFKHNMVVGKMRRSTPGGNFSMWHMARHFPHGIVPGLNRDFILGGFNDLDGAKRALFAPSEPAFLIDHCNHIKAIRPIPIQSSPGLIDHF